MFRPRSDSRLAVSLRRWRGRFGIAAPRVAIRTHLPWYWRALAIVVLSGVSLALAGWIYDTGRRYAGFHQTLSEGEIAEMRERLGRLESELDGARKIANGSESRLRIESTTQERLSARIKTLEEENTRLKADLAMFENLAGGAVNAAGPVISRLEVVPDGLVGQYRYRLLLAQVGEKKDREFKGVLGLVATVQQGAETAMIRIPAAGDPDPGRFQVAFRYFRRIEGSFKVPNGARVVRFEAKLSQDGAVKASQSVSL